ncbi:MAG: sugar transferase [Caldilineaceae bacterium]|nr:sugar transferase [Caldilineaceae bacterium]
MATLNNLNFPTSSVTAPTKRAVAYKRDSRLAGLVRLVHPAHWPILLLASDLLLILVAFGGAYIMRYVWQIGRQVDPANQVGIQAYWIFASLLVVVCLLSFRFSHVYPYKVGRSVIEETYVIGTATTLAVVILSGINLVYQPLSYSRLLFLYTAILITCLLGLSRLLIVGARLYLRQYGIGVKRVLLIGAGDVGRMVMRTVMARPELGYQVVGFLDDNVTKGQTDIGPFKALGPLENCQEVVTQHAIDHVIICLPWQSHRMIQRLLYMCERQQIRAQIVPDVFQLTKHQLEVEEIDGIPLLGTRALSIQGWNLIVKRAVDLVATILAGLLSLPLLGLIALAIRLDSAGPVIYRQTRIGKNGKAFTCYKFRSMVTDADELRNTLTNRNEATGPLFKVRNDPRQTRVGRWLRRYSLDELPQLYNVLRGEMSWVGPRPNLPHEVEQYQEWHKKRLSVSPGITGLWQVSGRSDLTFDEMVLLDIYYVENWSLALDLHILLRSIPAVFQGRGAY